MDYDSELREVILKVLKFHGSRIEGEDFRMNQQADMIVELIRQYNEATSILISNKLDRVRVVFNY